MFDKLKKLLRRKPKEVPPQVQKVGHSLGPEIIGRQGGQKRNRVHIYRQPFGYPIRLCDWVAVDISSIEDGTAFHGMFGEDIRNRALLGALDYYETVKGARICRHCRAVVLGKRTTVGSPMVKP